jgi:cysteine synthase A
MENETPYTSADRVHAGILSTIGNTPLIELRRMLRPRTFQIFAKLEFLNPGGSVKDRAARHIIETEMARGVVSPDSVIIESSSGNMGIGLAQACAYLGLRFICVIDPKTTRQNIDILRAYGAEIDLVSEPDPVSGEFLQARINRVHALLQRHPRSYWPNQYANRLNSQAHYRTMEEIVNQLEGRVDFVFVATSTCGTLRGCAEYIQEHRLPARVIAVDAVGSVIFGGPSAKRLIPGHGAARRPELYQPGLAHRCVHVTDLECVVGCRQLIRQEALMAGGSAGGVLTAVRRLQAEIPPESTCVVILGDRGERYLDTVFSDHWVAAHFGDVSHLWHTGQEA